MTTAKGLSRIVSTAELPLCEECADREKRVGYREFKHDVDITYRKAVKNQLPYLRDLLAQKAEEIRAAMDGFAEIQLYLTKVEEHLDYKEKAETLMRAKVGELQENVENISKKRAAEILKGVTKGLEIDE